jgi:malonyl-CoA O-methyltransferase
MSSPIDEYQLDMRAVRRNFDRASKTYARAAVVQAEIRARLLERLDLVKLQPTRTLDLGAASGQSSRALKDRYPKSQVFALDLSIGMLAEAAREQRLLRRFQRIAADAQRLPLRDGAIDLAVSNLMLAWCNNPDAVFRETARVLRPEGLFMFTTLGPDTLRELRTAFRRIDARTHVHRFIDMHDLGDALMRAGFSEPVMDTERLTITYKSTHAFLSELRATGSTNATAGRRRGLLARNHFEAIERELESQRRDGSIPLSLEVVYGHAWRGTDRMQERANPSEFTVPLSSLRRPR